jgi:PAS domain S-box-containing protein/putative nucleotidyltransferase with HDIG domain
MDKGRMKQPIRDKAGHKVKCWIAFQCDEKECPAYRSKNFRCWLFSGTHCRKEIQGEFLEKMEMCLNCNVFKTNMDTAAMRKTLMETNAQIKRYRKMVKERDREMESMSMELALGLSETFEALKGISSGDPAVRIPEASKVELIRKLKHMVNVTAENIGQTVDQFHEIAMGLAEHFDVLHRVAGGDLQARVTGISQTELLEYLKKLINETIESFAREIAEREEAENSLRKLEALESSVLRAIPHAVVGLRERRIFFANEAVEKVFGWTPGELIGRNTRILYRNDAEYEEIGRHFYPLLETERVHSEEYPCRHKDGRDIFCRVRAAVIGERMEEKGIVVVYEDITERKVMEEAILESEKKYLDHYQNAPDGFHSLGPDGTILEVNNTWLKMFGYERDEVVGKLKLTDLLADEGMSKFAATFSDLKQKGSIENIDYSLRRKDGMMLPVLLNATAIYDGKGEFLRTRTVVRDNSERKTYERKLERAAAEWRATFDCMPHGVMLIDEGHTIMRANSYMSEIFQIPFQDIVGKNCIHLNFGSRKPAEFCNALKAKDTGGHEILEYYDENLQRQFMVHWTPILDGGKSAKAYVLSFIDISDLKDKEKRLTESKDAFFNMLKELDVSYKELKGLYESLIHSFVNAIDAKSPWTKGHSERVTYYAVSIAKEMRLKEKDIETLQIAALLHDIGKIGTYDIVLDKPGKLTEAEFALIRMHPGKGEEILRPIKQFQHLLPIIRHHHERMDGRGYPDRLQGEEIPPLSRIITIADSYDSMTSDRPYRPAPPREYAISELQRCSGSQFEPQAVDAFLRVLKKLDQLPGVPVGSGI